MVEISVFELILLTEWLIKENNSLLPTIIKWNKPFNFEEAFSISQFVYIQICIRTTVQMFQMLI